jgi:ribosomal protein S18 acetylase RimI-like enzyme
MPNISLLSLTNQDKDWVGQFVLAQWGSYLMVSRGVLYDVTTHPGFVAVVDGERAGLITYLIRGDQCEITLLESMWPSIGVGTALIAAVKESALHAGCQRLWLITTNDNTHALRFYQKRGFVLVALHRDAIAQSRLLKPQIPLVGNDGIPIRDEIELEMPLNNQSARG